MCCACISSERPCWGLVWNGHRLHGDQTEPKGTKPAQASGQMSLDHSGQYIPGNFTCNATSRFTAEEKRISLLLICQFLSVLKICVTWHSMGCELTVFDQISLQDAEDLEKSWLLLADIYIQVCDILEYTIKHQSNN